MHAGPPNYPEELAAARTRLGAVLVPSPLERSQRLSAAFGRPVLLKREDLQPVRSYKVRGAFNLIAAMLASAPVPAVVAASAGNHAQGVAWCCRRLGIPGTIVLPSRTPRQKRQRIDAIGGAFVTVEIHGTVFDEAAARAAVIAADTGAVLVPAFDHPLVVAGQGTVTAEIVDQLAHLDAGDAEIVVPVGGGGLAAGAVVALSGTGHRLIVVEPAGAASLHAAWSAGAPADLHEVDSFVDGAAVRRVGAVPFSLLASHPGDQAMRIDEGAVASAMLELYQDDGIVAEPAGALSIAALEHLDGEGPVVCVISGGNNDISRYGEVIERSLVHRGLKHYFLVEFDQRPGALRHFLDEVLGPDDDITRFEYLKKNERETGPALIGIELARPDDLTGLLDRLAASPLEATRIEPDSLLRRFLL